MAGLAVPKIRDEYGFEFDGEHMSLDDLTLARIRYTAKQQRLQCNGISDYAGAYLDLENAARNLLALRHLQDRPNRGVT